MTAWNQERVLAAWNFASLAHHGQCVPGTDVAYINHIGSVTMEVMGAISQDPGCTSEPELAILCALLHDTIEDTGTSFDTVAAAFGTVVANGVQALSKDKELSGRRAQMVDSIARIKGQPREVWMVKLADRITNLQRPPAHWAPGTIQAYGEEAVFILKALGSAHPGLAQRLGEKIEQYAAWYEGADGM